VCVVCVCVCMFFFVGSSIGTSAGEGGGKVVGGGRGAGGKGETRGRCARERAHGGCHFMCSRKQAQGMFVDEGCAGLKIGVEVWWS
jgi:hypothetical protein